MPDLRRAVEQHTGHGPRPCAGHPVLLRVASAIVDGPVWTVGRGGGGLLIQDKPVWAAVSVDYSELLLQLLWSADGISIVVAICREEPVWTAGTGDARLRTASNADAIVPSLPCRHGPRPSHRHIRVQPYIPPPLHIWQRLPCLQRTLARRCVRGVVPVAVAPPLFLAATTAHAPMARRCVRGFVPIAVAPPLFLAFTTAHVPAVHPLAAIFRAPTGVGGHGATGVQ